METAKDFTTSILVDKTPSEVFNAINNVRGWWQGEISGNTGNLNDEFTYQMCDVHFSRQKVTELISDKKIIWLVTESRLSFVDEKDEWTNTSITFAISQEAGKTRLTFTHHGLVPAFECYDDCSGAWGALIQESLLSLINTGRGVKVF